MISQENTSVGVSFLIKLQGEDPKLYQKETSAQVFSCVYLKYYTLNWLIFCCCWLMLLLVLPNQILVKSSLTPLGRRKTVYVVGCQFSCLFTFY